MKKRKLKVIPLLGLALLAALAVLLWFLNDDDWIKGKIESSVLELTGRSLSIGGGFAVDWSLNTVLAAENVQLSNPPWAVNPHLATLNRLEVSIDLLSLFKGQVHINDIDIQNPVIALEEHASEGQSWDFTPVGKEPANGAAAPAGKLPFRIDRLHVEGLRVLHETPERAAPLDFRLDQLELTEEAGQELKFNAGGELGGRQFGLSGQLGPLDEIVGGGKVGLDVRFNMGEVSLQSRGAVEQLSTLSGVDVRLVFSGPEIEWILAQLALPGFSQGDFDFRLDVVTEGSETRLDIEGDLGSLQAHAKGKLNRQDESAELKAEVSGEDLGGLLELAGVKGLPRNPFRLDADISHATGAYRVQTLVLESDGASVSLRGRLGDWPQLLDSELDYSIAGDDLQRWGNALPEEWLAGIELPATDFELSGQIARTGDQPAVTDTSLRLGESRIRLTGVLGKLPAMIGADLAISAAGPDVGALLQSAGLQGIPAGAFSLKGNLERDADYFYLRETVVELAGNRLELSGQSGPWPEHRDARLVFSLAGADLSTWSTLLGVGELPASAFSSSGVISTMSAMLKLDDFRVQLGGSKLDARGTIGAWPELTGTELEFGAAAQTLSDFRFLPGMAKAPDLAFGVDGNLSRVAGGWAFRLSNGSLADASFETEGKYTHADGQSQVEATSRVSAPDLARTGRLIGIDKLPAQPLELEGFARYQPGRVELQGVEGHIGESRFEVSGTIMNPPTWSGSDLTISAAGPDVGQLLAERGFEDALPFSVRGSISRKEKSIHAKNVRASLGPLKAVVDGDLDDAAAADLEVDVSAPSLQTVGAFIEQPLPDEPLHMSATLQGTPRAFRAKQLKITLGESDLSGEFNVDLGGKPKVAGIFNSDFIDLRWPFDLDEMTAPEEAPERPGDRKYLIPDTPIAVARLDLADSDITVRVAELKLPKMTLHDIHLHSLVTGGNLLLEPFQFTDDGGAVLDGTLEIEQDQQTGLTDVSVSMHGSGVRLGIGLLEGQDPDTYPQSDISLDLSGSGVTYRDLASSLNGRAEVVRGSGLTGNTGLQLIFGNFISEAINMINPFAKTEKYTVGECAVAVANVESGLVKVNPVVIQSEKMTTVAEGNVDLRTENIVFTFNTKLRTGTGLSASMVVNPFISITGTLLNPVIGVDPAAVAVKGSVAVATMGISLLARSLADRYFSSKDPCGDALKKARESQGSSETK